MGFYPLVDNLENDSFCSPNPYPYIIPFLHFIVKFLSIKIWVYLQILLQVNEKRLVFGIFSGFTCEARKIDIFCVKIWLCHQKLKIQNPTKSERRTAMLFRLLKACQKRLKMSRKLPKRRTGPAFAQGYGEAKESGQIGGIDPIVSKETSEGEAKPAEPISAQTEVVTSAHAPVS